MSRELAVKINKMIGEDGHVRQASFTEWTPYNIAVFHPFVDGNKRTAFILLQFNEYKEFIEDINDELETSLIECLIEEYREWLDILEEC